MSADDLQARFDQLRRNYNDLWSAADKLLVDCDNAELLYTLRDDQPVDCRLWDDLRDILNRRYEPTSQAKETA